MGRVLKITSILCGVLLCLPYCARQSSTLTGGLRDTIPPVFLYAEPAMNSTGFSARRIDIYFDEYVKLQNINSTFIVSPPMSEKPEVVLYGKYIRIKLPEDPVPGYTYTMSFGETIVDNNENNKMGFFEYVFSTSDRIDSLTLTGRVLEAFTGNAPAQKEGTDIKVMLYNDIRDSIPYLERPAYIARADAYGFFEFNHLRADTFMLFVLEDVGDDMLFGVPDERIAFMDTLVIIDDACLRSEAEADLFHTDSVRAKTPEMVPHRLDLYLFQEEKSRQYRTSYNRPEPNRLVYTFNMPLDSLPGIALVDTVIEPAPFLPFLSAGRDTVTYWILDTTLVTTPMLRVALTSPVTVDSLKMKVARTDTLRMQAEAVQAPAATGRGRRRQENQVEAKRADEQLRLSSNADGGTLALNGRFYLRVSQPVSAVDMQRLHLFEVASDTVSRPVEFQFAQDSADLLRYAVDWPLQEQKVYRFVADTMAFTSVYGVHNDSTVIRVTVQSLDFYSNIQIALHNVQGHMLIQVFQQGRDKVFKQLEVDRNGVLNIAFLPPGQYTLKAVYDANANGKWDTGNYLKGIQPEKVDVYEDPVTTQSSFTTEVDWTLK